MHTRPRVIVIGGGFGGLAAVRALRAAAVDVLLIDRGNHHTFQPLLYQVALAVLPPAWPRPPSLPRCGISCATSATPPCYSGRRAA